jgi:hypothetical protein
VNGSEVNASAKRSANPASVIEVFWIDEPSDHAEKVLAAAREEGP